MSEPVNDEPVRRDGAVELNLEPQTADFVAEVARQPPTENLPLDVLRAVYSATVSANTSPPDVEVETRDLIADGETGPLSVRLYTPVTLSNGNTPLIVYVHGGGFAVGDLDSHDNLVRMIAASANVRALALDYRRAPEHPFPAARNDVLAVFRWAAAHASELGIDATRIALAGESAGGTHAVAAALALRDDPSTAPAALMAFVPALDPTTSGPSYEAFSTGTGRTATEFRYLWSLYIPDDSVRADAATSPMAADPTGLPPTIVYTAEFDPARDDGEAFVAKAEAAGVDVTHRRVAGAVHQFPEITRLSPVSRAAVEEASAALGELLRR